MGYFYVVIIAALILNFTGHNITAFLLMVVAITISSIHSLYVIIRTKYKEKREGKAKLKVDQTK